LKLSLPLKELVKDQQETNDLTVSPVALMHVLTLDALPFHHKARLIVCGLLKAFQNGLLLSPQIRSSQPIRLSCWNNGRGMTATL
jgi:hypothetical protein